MKATELPDIAGRTLSRVLNPHSLHDECPRCFGDRFAPPPSHHLPARRHIEVPMKAPRSEHRLMEHFIRRLWQVSSRGLPVRHLYSILRAPFPRAFCRQNISQCRCSSFSPLLLPSAAVQAASDGLQRALKSSTEIPCPPSQSWTVKVSPLRPVRSHFESADATVRLAVVLDGEQLVPLPDGDWGSVELRRIMERLEAFLSATEHLPENTPLSRSKSLNIAPHSSRRLTGLPCLGADNSPMSASMC